MILHWKNSMVYTCMQRMAADIATPFTYRIKPEDLSILRGLVKLKTIQKSEKNSDWSDPIPPPPIQFLIFFLIIWKHENKKKKKKKNPSWGLTLTPTSEFFSDFWIFLTWQNPLAVKNVRGRKPRPFRQLRMENSEGFNWLKTHPTIMRIPHKQQLGHNWLIIIQ